MALKHQNMLNRTIKGYTFLSILGQGAFAKVYQAVNQKDNSQLAIKVIPQKLLVQTPKLQELVKTQIKVLRSCKNQNVIRFIDSFTSNMSIFIAVQYCNGGDLQHYLTQKKRLTQDEATNFLKQILNGFKGLHETGAMHRDFKLANVLIHNGICKIADLGFAKQMQKRSVTTTILGTSLTMAPEVLEQRPYGMEADLWSIGVVYYQMIYGKYPYTGLNDFDILKKIKNTKPDFSLVKISSECRDFIEKCLTINPKLRIRWADIYSHPLLAKNQARFIYGALKSKISLGNNKNYYQEKKFDEEHYPNIDDILKKNDFLDVNWEDGGQIRQSYNVGKLTEQANQKKQKQMEFNNYEKKYVNRRNNIMFIFKYVCPFSDQLVKFKANHGIALFITAKKAYLDMKNMVKNLKNQQNVFNIKNNWNQFSKSSIYANIIKQFQGDLEMIQAQALSYKFDIEIQSKQIEAQQNIQHASSKNWQKLVKDTVNQYWFLLAESVLQYKVDKYKKQTVKTKEVLIKVLQALDYYRQNKIADIEQFDKIMEGLNYEEAQSKIQQKIQDTYK